VVGWAILSVLKGKEGIGVRVRPVATALQEGKRGLGGNPFTCRQKGGGGGEAKWGVLPGGYWRY